MRFACGLSPVRGAAAKPETAGMLLRDSSFCAPACDRAARRPDTNEKARLCGRAFSCEMKIKFHPNLTFSKKWSARKKHIKSL
jgi:hypothetical protein